MGSKRATVGAAINLKAVFEPYVKSVDREMHKALTRKPDYAMYGMMRYFLGFADEKLRPLAVSEGKRFRPGLCLLIAESYGVAAQALPAAVSIELFHNFSLIHDDIEDCENMRRGRPTVWKLWGVNHAINTGDGQLVLAHRQLAQIGTTDPALAAKLMDFLPEQYLTVVEGQYLDFELTDLTIADPRMTRKAYFEMLTKKTAVLVGAATKTAGIVSGVSKQELDALWRYGLSLGLAYQLYDDAMSVWGSEAQTGKDRWGDIKTRKKTLPVLIAVEKLRGDDRARMIQLYDGKKPLKTAEIKEIRALFDRVDALDVLRAHIKRHAQAAKRAAGKLTIAPSYKQTLVGIVDALMPHISL